ncbi:MAG: hypothetical protein WBW84_24010 [Acidobacteriaceae bacterium]
MGQNGDRPQLLLDSVILGIVGGLSARVFMWLLRLSQKIFLIGIAGYHPPGLPDEGGVLREAIGIHGLWLIPVATTLACIIHEPVESGGWWRDCAAKMLVAA